MLNINYKHLLKQKEAMLKHQFEKQGYSMEELIGRCEIYHQNCPDGRCTETYIVDGKELFRVIEIPELITSNDDNIFRIGYTIRVIVEEVKDE